MITKRFYYIEDMSIIMGKSIAAIHGHLARRQFDAVPQPIKLGRRLAWLADVVDAWIDGKAPQSDDKQKDTRDNHVPPARRRGRPRKGDQKPGRGE